MILIDLKQNKTLVKLKKHLLAFPNEILILTRTSNTITPTHNRKIKRVAQTQQHYYVGLPGFTWKTVSWIFQTLRIDLFILESLKFALATILTLISHFSTIFFEKLHSSLKWSQLSILSRQFVSHSKPIVKTCLGMAVENAVCSRVAMKKPANHVIRWQNSYFCQK